MITYELFFLHHACLHIQKLSYNSPRQWIPQNGFHSIHDYYDYDYHFIHHHQSIYFYDQLDLSWVVAGDTELNTMEDEQANAFRIWRKEYSCLIFAVNTYGIHLSLDNENNNKSNNHNHQQQEKNNNEIIFSYLLGLSKQAAVHRSIPYFDKWRHTQ